MACPYKEFAMKLALKSQTVSELFRQVQGTEKYGPLGSKASNPQATGAKFISFSGRNYVVHHDYKDVPPGFTLKTGGTPAVFLFDNRVAGRKLKIPVGLTAGKKGTEKIMSLTEARD